MTEDRSGVTRAHSTEEAPMARCSQAQTHWPAHNRLRRSESGGGTKRARSIVYRLLLLIVALVPAISGLRLMNPVGVAAASYASTVIADAPAIYYRLGEASGTTVGDSSGNSRNALYTTAASLGHPGAIATDTDTAISTSGQAISYASTTGLPLGNTARSVEIWFATSSWNRQTLMSYGIDSSGQAFAVEVLNQDHFNIRVLGSAQNDYTFSAGRNISDGNWHHVVATYDGTTFAIYLDSVSLGTEVNTSAPLNTASNGMSVGSLNSPGDNAFQGRLDEFALFPSALTATQVTTHFNASGNSLPTAPGSVVATGQSNAILVRWRPSTAVTPSGQSSVTGYIVTASAGGSPASAVAVGGSATSATLRGVAAASSVTVHVVGVNGFGAGPASSAIASVGGLTTTYTSSVLSQTPDLYYRFGDPSGTIAADAASSGQHGTYYSGRTLGVTGAVQSDQDSAAGTGGSLTYCQPCSNLPTGDTARSYEVWVNTTSTGRQALFTYGVESGSMALAVELLNSTTLYVRTIDGNDPQWTLPSSVADGHWHQLAVTYSNPTFTVYVDGAAAGTFTRTIALQTSIDSTGLITGSLNNGSDAYSGSLDELSIYPKALTAQQVAAQYSLATSGFAPIGGAVTAPQAFGGADLSRPCSCGRPIRAEPVDTTDGNFWESATDLAIPGRGFALQFTRTYNSLGAATNGPLGYGWSGSYGASLTVDPGTGNVTVLQENGSQALFNQTSAGPPPTFAPAAPRDVATLTQAIDGSWTFTRRNVETLTFSSARQLTSLKDPNGYVTTLAYDMNGHLSSVTDSAARAVSVHFTGALITSLSDLTGRTVTYGYNDGAGDLTDVTDVNGGHWHFAYDTSHRLLTISDPRQNTVTTNHYDSSGRIDYQLDGLQRKTTFTYAPDGSSTVTTDPMNNSAEDVFSNGLRVAEVRGYGTPQAATWTYSYDPATLSVASIKDPNGHTTTMGYDSNGNMVSRVDPLGQATTWTYNAFNETSTSTDPNSVTTTYTYDSNGNLLSTSTPLVGSTPPQARTVGNTYGDTAHPGDITTITDSDGKLWQRSYDTYGDVASSTDPLGNRTTFTYSSLGWLQTVVSPRGNVTGGTPSQYTTTYSYADPSTGTVDQFGDVRVVTDPLGHQVVTSYDADRNKVSLRDADGNLSQYTYDTANEETDLHRPDGTTMHTDYNLDGTTKDQVDGAGNTTSFGYDPLARMTSETDPLQRVTNYTYDAAGNRLTMVDAQSPRQTTTYGYDVANQLTAISYSDGRTPNVSGIQYDADGQRLQLTDGTGTSTWTYDSLHRMSSSKNGAGSAVAYGYDLKGQLTSITYPGNHTVQRQYDDAGRLISVADWLSNTTTFTPDPDSNVTAQIYPNGTTATTTFDRSGRAASISDAPTASPNSPFATFTYTRDNNSQLSSVSTSGVPADTHSYTYTPTNQLRGVDSQAYAYSAADTVTQLTNGTLLSADPADQLSSSESQPITVVGTAGGGDTGTGKTLTVNLPAGVSANDQILVASTQQSGKTVNVPTGYTQVASVSSTGSPAANTVLFRKTATGGETQVSMTYSARFAKSVDVVVYRGVNPTAPVDVQSSGTSAATTAVTAGSVTPPYGGDRLALFGGAVGNATAAAWTPPPGMTAQAQFASQPSTSASSFDQTLLTVGATGSRTASFGATSQFAAVMVALRPATLSTYSFDPRGNRVTTTPPGGSATTYSYDQVNRMAGYGSSATYGYNGDGLRASKTVNGTVETYTWNEAEGQPSLLVDSTASTTTYFVYGAGGAPLEQITAGGTVSYYDHDQLGSTRLLTNQSGTVVATYTYDSYGSVTGSTGTVTTPLLYAGQYRDSESGLYYMQARYYDPSTAQFVTRDPAVTSTRSPYAYVNNNPLNGTDPSGLWCGLDPFQSCDPRCPDSVQPLGPWQCSAAVWTVHNAPAIASVADRVSEACGIIGFEECSAAATNYALLFHAIADASKGESDSKFKENLIDALVWGIIGKEEGGGAQIGGLHDLWSLIHSLQPGTQYTQTYDETVCVNGSYVAIHASISIGADGSTVSIP